jgi:hypothetical protein
MNGSVTTVRLLLDYKVDANRANKVLARLEPWRSQSPQAL